MSRDLHRAGVWGAMILLVVAFATALSTAEAERALVFVTGAAICIVAAVGWLARLNRGSMALLSGPLVLMVYLLVYGALAPQAATFTISLWPAVFTFVGVTATPRVGAWLLPVPAVGIWLAMDLPVGLEIPRWLVVMGLVVVVTQLPARLLEAVDERQRRLESEHRDVLASQRALAVSMERFGQAFSVSPVGMSLADENGHFIEVNPALCELVGRTSAQLVGRGADEMTHPDDRHFNDEAQMLMEASPDGRAVIEKRYVRPDGTQRSVELTLVPVRGPGRHMWTLAHVNDITARKASEEASARSERISRVLADVARSVVQRRDDVRDAVARGARQLTGATGVALVESRDDRTLVVTGATDPNHLGLEVDLDQLTMTGTVWETGAAVDVVDVATEATVNPALAELHTMASGYWQPVLGPHGEVLAVLAASWDQPRTATTNEVRQAMDVLAAEAGAALYDDGARRRLEASVFVDPLTRLTNRRGWDSGLTRMVGRAADGEMVAVAMIDLDRFKEFNDARGHQHGDHLLTSFAAVIRRSVRTQDLVSRWGGDEFAIAMVVGSAAQARAVVDRVVDAVPEGQTCSIGLAVHSSGEDVVATIARADRALYSVKSSGRDGVAVAG